MARMPAPKNPLPSTPRVTDMVTTNVMAPDSPLNTVAKVKKKISGKRKLKKITARSRNASLMSMPMMARYCFMPSISQLLAGQFHEHVFQCGAFQVDVFQLHSLLVQPLHDFKQCPRRTRRIYRQ